MKRILIMESGSLELEHIKPRALVMKGISFVDSTKKITGKKLHGTLGGAAKASYQLYQSFSKMKGYKVDFFADFSNFTQTKGLQNSHVLMKNNYDIIFMNSTRDALLIDEYMKNHKKTKVIYTDRNNALVNFSDVKKFHPRNPAMGYLLFQMRKWLTCYVGITKEQERKAHNFFTSKTKVTYVSIAPDKIYRKLVVKKTFEGAIYVGRLDERQKKVAFLIEGVAKTVKEHHLGTKKLLKIIGIGPDEDRYKEMAAKLGVDANIMFKGGKFGDELVREYNNSGFFVSTSEWESPGRAFLEAMACGLPILINTSNNEGIVNKGYNGLLYKYDDMHDFVEKFYFMYSNKRFREHLGEGALRSVKAYSLETTLSKYKKLVDSL